MLVKWRVVLVGVYTSEMYQFTFSLFICNKTYYGAKWES